VGAMHFLYWRFKSFLLRWKVDQGRAIHFYVFFSGLSCGGGRVLLSAKIIAMWYLALVWDLNHSHFLGATVHFEVIEVVDARSALHGLHLLEMVLFEVIAHCLLVIIIKKGRRLTI